jgi:hypothetical protein
LSGFSEFTIFFSKLEYFLLSRESLTHFRPKSTQYHLPDGSEITLDPATLSIPGIFFQDSAENKVYSGRGGRRRRRRWRRRQERERGRGRGDEIPLDPATLSVPGIFFQDSAENKVT